MRGTVARRALVDVHGIKLLDVTAAATQRRREDIMMINLST